MEMSSSMSSPQTSIDGGIITKEEAKALLRDLFRTWMLRGFVVTAILLVTILVCAAIYYAIDPLGHDEQLSYATALYFMFETYSTIGYGDFAPSTAGGKVFICVSSIIIVPLFFTVLILVFTPGLEWLASHVRVPLNRIGFLQDTLLTSSKTHLLQGLLLLIVLSILIPSFAGVFVILEPWSYGEALYFSVITITTIGYGDLTLSTDLSRGIFVLFCFFVVSINTMFVGLISSLFAMRLEKARQQSKQHLKHLRQTAFDIRERRSVERSRRLSVDLPSPPLDV